MTTSSQHHAGIGPAVPAAPGRSGLAAGRYRTRTTLGALGLTALSALLPGAGMVAAGRRRAGLWVLVPTLLLIAAAAWFLLTRPRQLLAIGFDPEQLMGAAIGSAVLLLAWVGVVVATYVMVRPARSGPGQELVGALLVAALCLIVAAPLYVTARYSLVQRDVVTTVFPETLHSPTAPTVTDAVHDPWNGADRVNVLLLGGDGGEGRVGVRTDSVIVASTDVDTGDTVLFSLPRNLEHVPFPEGSPLRRLYPDGFDGPGSNLEWMLNSVYRNVPALHPKILGKSDNEGADALKQAVSGALGLDVDYYLLINLAGFRKVVDAIGGVTVNINHPIPIGGNTDLDIPPQDYLQPGPDQHLDGFEALWYARGRYGLDDYDRMERQRCMVDAIVEAADPMTLLRRYEALAEAGKQLVRTDIPQQMLPAFLDLAFKIKDADLRSVVFKPSARFTPANPDYAWMHATVRRALEDRPSPGASGRGPKQGGGKGDRPRGRGERGPVQTPEDACAYQPPRG